MFASSKSRSAPGSPSAAPVIDDRLVGAARSPSPTSAPAPGSANSPAASAPAGARRATRLARRPGGLRAAPVATGLQLRRARAATGIPSGCRAQPGGPEAAEGVVERSARRPAWGGCVARLTIVVVAEHVRGEALQRVLRADLDEDPRALVVQRAQALHELHRRGDLAAEDVEHLLDDVGAGRIELAVDVGDDRELRADAGRAAGASPAAARSPAPRSRCGRRG